MAGVFSPNYLLDTVRCLLSTFTGKDPLPTREALDLWKRDVTDAGRCKDEEKKPGELYTTRPTNNMVSLLMFTHRKSTLRVLRRAYIANAFEFWPHDFVTKGIRIL